MERIYTNDAETQEENIYSGGRWNEAAILTAYREMSKNGISLAQVAKDKGIPESTMRHWVSRAQTSGEPLAWSNFFESFEGLQLLHQIVVAINFVLTQIAGGGVRTICLFLELSGLWRFVASGYGTQCVAVQEMEKCIGKFGKQQRDNLAPNMPNKPITLTEDETFHACQTCLVASEPVSNFILLEGYAEDRQAKTWDAKVEQALKGLPVEVIQSTSDEGKALIKHARESLGVHHSPDLFHPQQDISRATSLPLQRQVKRAEKDVNDAKQGLEAVKQEAQAYAEQSKGPGRPRDYGPCIEQSKQEVQQAEAELAEARRRRERVRQEARGISSSYHPFDLKTGKARDASIVESELNEHFDVIEEAAAEVGISSACWALLKKARCLLPQMSATIAFVHTTIQNKVAELKLSEALEQMMFEYLIPLYYLEEVARKATTAYVRDELLASRNALRKQSKWAFALLTTLGAEQHEAVEYVARTCAQIFQRSSSNVEGRNGVLALRHHSFHILSSRKLQALTVVHNFVIRRREDGTTAAERFFEQSHDDLFEYLLLTLPPPKRPAAQRSRPLNQGILN